MEEWQTVEKGDFTFNDSLKQFFGATRGAFSRATATEVGDHQITVTRNEKAIFNDYFSDYPRGAITGDDTAKKEFKLYPTGEIIRLNVNYPKTTGSELRLYIRGGIFKPDIDSAWFVFEKEGDIWLGSLDPTSFNLALGGGAVVTPITNVVDLTDDEFLGSLNLPQAPGTEERFIARTKRDPRIARKVISAAEACEILPGYPSFISKFSGKVFLEAHHLIPMSLQPRFDFSLDVASNICALNPFSHRMLHYGRFSDIEGHIESLARRRQALLDKLGINIDYVKQVYAGAE